MVEVMADVDFKLTKVHVFERLDRVEQLMGREFSVFV